MDCHDGAWKDHGRQYQDLFRNEYNAADHPYLDDLNETEVNIDRIGQLSEFSFRNIISISTVFKNRNLCTLPQFSEENIVYTSQVSDWKFLHVRYIDNRQLYNSLRFQSKTLCTLWCFPDQYVVYISLIPNVYNSKQVHTSIVVAIVYACAMAMVWRCGQMCCVKGH